MLLAESGVDYAVSAVPLQLRACRPHDFQTVTVSLRHGTVDNGQAPYHRQRLGCASDPVQSVPAALMNPLRIGWPFAMGSDNLEFTYLQIFGHPTCSSVIEAANTGKALTDLPSLGVHSVWDDIPRITKSSSQSDSTVYHHFSVSKYITWGMGLGASYCSSPFSPRNEIRIGWKECDVCGQLLVERFLGWNSAVWDKPIGTPESTQLLFFQNPL